MAAAFPFPTLGIISAGNPWASLAESLLELLKRLAEEGQASRDQNLRRVLEATIAEHVTRILVGMREAELTAITLRTSFADRQRRMLAWLNEFEETSSTDGLRAVPHLELHADGLVADVSALRKLAATDRRLLALVSASSLSQLHQLGDVFERVAGIHDECVAHLESTLEIVEDLSDLLRADVALASGETVEHAEVRSRLNLQ